MANSNDLHNYKNESFEDLVDLIVAHEETIEEKNNVIDELENTIDELENTIVELTDELNEIDSFGEPED